MRVVWSNRALRSLADIHTHVSTDSEEAANRTVDNILKRGEHLSAFPQLGRVVERYKRPGIRELVEAPYRIVYRVRRQDGRSHRRFSLGAVSAMGTLKRLRIPATGAPRHPARCPVPVPRLTRGFT